MRPPDRNKRITSALLRRWGLPPPGDGGKEARGRILVIAGSPSLPGPVILAAVSALRAGAGKLQIATSAPIALHVAAAVPEALVVPFEDAAELAAGADAIVFGPGMTQDAACGELLHGIAAKTQAPIVVDAAGLGVLREDIAIANRAVLTPHFAEMARLLQCSPETVENDPRGCLKDAIERFSCVVALKSRTTLIAGPGTPVYENRRGHPGLATSGSGDALAGVIGGILARGTPPVRAAAWGVYLHARAGERLGRELGTGFLARELPIEIAALMRKLSS